jgi:pseudouridine-5'-phosphate glycosidase
MNIAAAFVVDLLFQPGSSMRLVPAINATVLILLVVMICVLSTSGIDGIHVGVMTTLAVGLLCSVNW